MMSLVRGFSDSEATTVFEEASARLKASRPALTAELIDKIATAVIAKIDADEMPLLIEESEVTAAVRSEVGRIADLYAKSNPLNTEAEIHRLADSIAKSELLQRKYGPAAIQAMLAKIIDMVFDEMNQRPKTKTPTEDAAKIGIEILERLVAKKG
jgi:predicted ArsR family transcriptional regulator